MRLLSILMLIGIFGELSAQVNVTTQGRNDEIYKLNDFKIRNNQDTYIDILSIEAFGGSNTAKLNLASYTKLDASLIRSDILREVNQSTGLGGFKLAGPSVSFGVGGRLRIGFSSALRVMGNYTNVDGRLVSEVGETTKTEHQYPIAISSQGRMSFNSAMFSSFGVDAGYRLWQDDKRAIDGSISTRYVNGIAHAALQTEDLTGVIKLNRDNVSYLTEAKGNIQTRSSGEFFSDASFSALFKPRKATIANDIGITYSQKNIQTGRYKLVIGITVTDIGKVRYQADTALSKSYTADINQFEGLYFNNNFSNSSFSETAKVFDSYPKLFTRKSSSNETYKVALPTSLRIHGDYEVSTLFYLSMNAVVNLQSSARLNALYEYNQFTITPRFFQKNLSLAIPLSYQNHLGLNLGGELKYKTFMIGSRSIFTNALGARQINIYTGLKMRLGH